MSLDAVLAKALDGGALEREDLFLLLTSTAINEHKAIFAAARELRARYFGHRVFLYGFIYFSTFCSNDCSFCFYRRSNPLPGRYRKSAKEIVQTAVELAHSGVHLIDLTMGEDDFFLTRPESLASLVTQVRAASGLPVMVSPGVLDGAALDRLAAAGASWYALYQESYSEALFARLRLGQSPAVRLAAKSHAARHGLLLEEGLLVGVGETPFDLLVSLEAMRSQDFAQVRAMTFIPQQGTTLSHRTPDFSRELLLIAVMRLVFPRRLIPASLDVDGLVGLAERLDAGANVITSIIPSGSGLVGVAHAEKDIDEGFRTVAGVQPLLRARGLESASVGDYADWIRERSWVHR